MNYKRKRPRVRSHNSYTKRKKIRYKGKYYLMTYEEAKEKNLPESCMCKFYFWTSTPATWNIMYHSRPRRKRDKIRIKQIMNGYLSADNAIFALSKKPHVYYW